MMKHVNIRLAHYQIIVDLHELLLSFANKIFLQLVDIPHMFWVVHIVERAMSLIVH